MDTIKHTIPATVGLAVARVLIEQARELIAAGGDPAIDRHRITRFLDGALRDLPPSGPATDASPDDEPRQGSDPCS